MEYKKSVKEKDLFCDYIKNLIINNDIEVLLELENSVVERNIPELSYLYASRVENASIDKHEQVVVASKDIVWNYLFAKNVKGANVDIHGDIIIGSNDPYYNYLFALNVCGADIKRHSMVVFLSGDAEYNYFFAKDIDNADIKLHEKAVALSENARFINKFMRDIPGADLDILSNAIIRGGNPYWNYVIAKDYGINVAKHGQVVYNSLNAEYNCLFAINVDGADIELHGKAVELSGNEKYINWFNKHLGISNSRQDDKKLELKNY